MRRYSPEKDESLDRRIFDHIAQAGQDQGRQPNIREALSQRIHDYSIDEALANFLLERSPEDGSPGRTVGIMGGHATNRDDPFYRKTAELAWLLTRAGYLVVTGGGPGAMEAANLGAYLSRWDRESIDEAVGLLEQAPAPGTPSYLAKAQAVVAKFPDGAVSLGVPTWFYGYEPTNLFGTHVAKYFANSIREAGLLAIATSGVVFTPGSAGTRQEIFMDATQNHYAVFEWCSPMVFLGKQSYTADAPVFQLLQATANDNYRDLLLVSDDPREIVGFIKSHPPRKPKT